MTIVGIKELKAGLSHYVNIAASGESISVTARGLPVALLSPIPPEVHAVNRMKEAGHVRWSGKKFAPPALPEKPRKGSQKNPNVSGAVIEDRER